MKELTSVAVKQLFAVITQSYDTTIIEKKDSKMMKLIAKLLDVLHIQDKEEFLDNYAITLGNDIYLPFAPGDEHHSLISQVRACAHEHQHVVIMEREGVAAYNLMYAFSSATRAIYEAECYRADMEVHWWYSTMVLKKPEMMSTASAADKLKEYGCSAQDIKVAKASLDKAAKLVKKGGVSCQAAIDVIKFFGWTGKKP